MSRRVRVGVHAPWISHLLFADDCLVFASASAAGAGRLHKILETYRRGSGQLVNRSNASVFFSANCTQAMKLEVHVGSGIPTEALVEKYLGLPTALGRSTDAQFEHIVTKIKKIMHGGSPRLLSSAGREVKVKAVCQAIPTFSMTCFRLSKKLCKNITTVVARFWWGGDEGRRKMYWRRWEELATPKCEGGMGFKDFQLFNQAMLAKQGWRLLTNPKSLCARVLRAKCYHGGDFMTARKKKNSSHTWRAILHGREALRTGIIKRIGEAYAIRDGVQLALQYGFRSVQIESDALEVVNLIYSNAFERTEVAPICQEIVELAGGFDHYKLAHIKRDANEAAHLCARQTNGDRRRCFWVNYVLSFLDKC